MTTPNRNLHRRRLSQLRWIRSPKENGRKATRTSGKLAEAALLRIANVRKGSGYGDILSTARLLDMTREHDQMIDIAREGLDDDK